ncbi:MAG: hypothetical protein IJP54_08765 [Synergistaceae bacterium]|nr:hypothetical protein [Synergistaceae bacterium]
MLKNSAYSAGMCLYRFCVSTFFALGGLRILRRKYGDSIPERTGRLSGIPEGAIWIHAVSVGEVQSASSLIRRIKSRSAYPCIL